MLPKFAGNSGELVIWLASLITYNSWHGVYSCITIHCSEETRERKINIIWLACYIQSIWRSDWRMCIICVRYVQTLVSLCTLNKLQSFHRTCIMYGRCIRTNAMQECEIVHRWPRHLSNRHIIPWLYQVFLFSLHLISPMLVIIFRLLKFLENYNFPLLGWPTTSQFQIVSLASKNHYPHASQYYETNSTER